MMTAEQKRAAVFEGLQLIAIALHERPYADLWHQVCKSLCAELACNRTFRETLMQAISEWTIRKDVTQVFATETEAAVERIFQRHGVNADGRLICSYDPRLEKG